MSDKSSTFALVCDLERPLTCSQRLLEALLLISEALDEPGGSAINEVAWTIDGHLKQLLAGYSALFRRTHPDRARFEREGWPGGQDE